MSKDFFLFCLLYLIDIFVLFNGCLKRLNIDMAIWITDAIHLVHFLVIVLINYLIRQIGFISHIFILPYDRSACICMAPYL